LRTAVVHITAQTSSDNLSPYPHTITIAQTYLLKDGNHRKHSVTINTVTQGDKWHSRLVLYNL